MDVEQFTNSPIGKVVPIKGEHRGRAFSHFAYVPDPLPSSLSLEDTTVLPDGTLAQAVAEMRVGTFLEFKNVLGPALPRPPGEQNRTQRRGQATVFQAAPAVAN